MKFSVRNAGRKWSCSGFRCGQWPSVAVAAVLLMASAGPGSASLSDRAVPLPRPRPAEAPANPDKPAEQAPAPSACRLALTEEIAIAPSIPPITGPGERGGTDLVRLEAIVMPDNKGRVTLTHAAT